MEIVKRIIRKCINTAIAYEKAMDLIKMDSNVSCSIGHCWMCKYNDECNKNELEEF